MVGQTSCGAARQAMETRRLFQEFDMIEVALKYMVAAGKGVPAKEMVIRGAG